MSKKQTIIYLIRGIFKGFTFLILAIELVAFYLSRSTIFFKQLWNMNSSILLFGVLVGAGCAVIGIVLFLLFRPIRDSISFLEGELLTKQSNWFVFFLLLSVVAEELFARYPVLFLWKLHANLSILLISALFFNTWWAADHVFNRFDKLLINARQTIFQALPHIILILVFGFLLFFMTIWTNSLITPFVTHFVLNSIFALFYRYLKRPG